MDATVAVRGVEEELRELVDALVLDAERVAERSGRRMVGELPSYRDHDPDELMPLLRANVSACLQDIRQPVQPESEERRESHRLAGRTRAAQGVTVDDMLHAWRIAAEEMRGAARREASRRGVRDAVVLEFIDRTLTWVDSGMLESAAAHRSTELDIARHEQDARANLVRGVLFGTLPLSELKLHAMAYGLDLGVTYVPFRARLRSDMPVRTAEALLGVADAAGPRRGLAALIDGDLAGLTSRLPALRGDGDGLVIGTGPEGAVDALEHGFRLATRALGTAVAIGRSGVVRFEELGLHPAVLGDDDVGDPVVRRIIEPLEARGPAGRTMLETVDRYLANDRRIDVTAKELHAHVNTIRHRLRRFEELTGQSLRETAGLVETWWAIERARAGGAGLAPPPSTSAGS